MKLSDERVSEIRHNVASRSIDDCISVSEFRALCKEVLAAREMRDMLDCYAQVNSAINCEEDLGEAVEAYDKARRGE